jgi:lysophospholipase L1-like esterase
MKFVFLMALLFSFGTATSQALKPMPLDLKTRLPQINVALNRILYQSALDPFFLKLQGLKTTSSGKVNIVHIGDSHIQADFLSGYLRTALQSFFGDAGRGLVFPYRVARTNGPSDVFSHSNNDWIQKSILHSGITASAGLCGYVIQTIDIGASIQIRLAESGTNKNTFTRLKLFLDSNLASSWSVRTANNTYFVAPPKASTFSFRELSLAQNSRELLLGSSPNATLKSFYGVSLENDQSGILYHSIGVNGARFDQYNKASLFWKQLPALEADLYIISLGTNEAQGLGTDEKTFTKSLSTFIENIKIASPAACILLTTAPDSFKGNSSNAALRNLNHYIYGFCLAQNVPVWDFYRVANGFGSATGWYNCGMMAKDRLHFTAKGYRIQGQLLFNALANAYDEFLDRH